MRLFKKKTIALYFFLCPLELAINIFLTSSTKYVGIIILLVWLVDIICNRDSVRFAGWKHIIILLVWMVYEVLITLLIGERSDRTSEYLMTYIMMVTLVIICSQEEWKKEEIDLFLNAYYFGSVLMIIIAILLGNNVYEGRSTVIIMGRNCDPNQLAASVLPGAFIALDKLTNKNRWGICFIHLLALMLVIYGVMSTGSRGGLLGLLVGIIILLYRILSTKGHFYHVIVLLVIGYFVLNILPNQTLDRLRYSDEYLSGSGRSTIWGTIIKSFDEKWIVGHGVGSTISFLIDYYGKASAVHNTYLLVMYESGIIGFALFIYILFDLLMKNIKKGETLLGAILAGAMVNSFFLDSLNLRYLWNGILLCGMQLVLFSMKEANQTYRENRYIR